MSTDNIARGLAVGAKNNPQRPTGFSKVKYRMSRGDNVNIFHLSDSTGAGTVPRRAILRFADDLAAAYPNYSVSVTAGDNTGWTGTTAISTGTSSATCTIWNLAISGTNSQSGMGSLFYTMVRPVPADCFILNHGKNHWTGTPDPSIRGEMLAAIEQYRMHRPETPIVVMRQPPNSDSSGMAAVMSAIDIMETVSDFSTVDAYTPFIQQNKAASLYVDTVHPSDLGYALWETATWAHWKASPPVPFMPTAPTLSPLLSSEANLLRNGGFDNWTTSPGAPPSWAASGSITVSKDTTILARDELGYSAKLLGTGGSTSLNQNVSGAALSMLKGQPATLAVRRYIDGAQSSTVGRICMTAGSAALGTQTVISRALAQYQTGWVWWVISGFQVPADAGYLTIILYHDTSGTPSTSPANFDQAVLVPGYLPRRCR